jgi:Holliday junction resolvasome RuvABC endonuclease subunit
MKIIALDISSKNTGWTAMVDGYLVETGDITPPANADHPEKLHFFRTALLELIANHQPAELCIEDVWAGKNKLTYKILSLYHGVVYQLTAEAQLQLQIMTPSRFRRLVGAVHNIKLNYAEREEAKKAVGSLVCTIYPELSSSSEDVHDSTGIAMAAHYWRKKLDEELAVVRAENPKIKSANRLLALATGRAEDYFKGLEKQNAKSVGSPGGKSRDKPRRNKKGL